MQNVQNGKIQSTVSVSKEMQRYNILLNCIRIESTDGNFGTHEKIAISISIVTCTLHIPIFGIFVFPFSCDFHGNPMVIGIPESHAHLH